MSKDKYIAVIFAAAFSTSTTQTSAEEAIDASDPTNIYSYAGPGYKYTQFTNDDYLQGLRVIGNPALSTQDSVLFEFGNGKYHGTVKAGEEDTGMTNLRARWFHLFDMDYSVVSGYRGWAAQIDVQLEGEVKCTKGTNTIALGVIPAYGIDKEWALYLPVNYVSTWDHNFNSHQRHGISFAPMAACALQKADGPDLFTDLAEHYTL